MYTTGHSEHTSIGLTEYLPVPKNRRVISNNDGAILVQRMKAPCPETVHFSMKSQNVEPSDTVLKRS